MLLPQHHPRLWHEAEVLQGRAAVFVDLARESSAEHQSHHRRDVPAQTDADRNACELHEWVQPHPNLCFAIS